MIGKNSYLSKADIVDGIPKKKPAKDKELASTWFQLGREAANIKMQSDLLDTKKQMTDLYASIIQGQMNDVINTLVQDAGKRNNTVEILLDKMQKERLAGQTPQLPGEVGAPAMAPPQLPSEVGVPAGMAPDMGGGAMPPAGGAPQGGGGMPPEMAALLAPQGGGAPQDGGAPPGIPQQAMPPQM